MKIFLVFSRAFWSEPNRLPVILYNSSTEQNGASAVSDDIIRNVERNIIYSKLVRDYTLATPAL